MKFAYRRFLVELFDGEPVTEIYRPIVPILVNGPRDSVLVHALLDTGADFTLFPLTVASLIGVEPDRSRPGTVGGIEGGSLVTYPCQVELELNDRTQSHRWLATVRFADGNNILLGHLGCLEFLTATLDHSSRAISLEPNAHFHFLR
jgi:hypothetical protein